MGPTDLTPADHPSVLSSNSMCSWFFFVSGWWWLGDWFLHFVFSGLNLEADFCILKGTDHLECCAEECYYCT